MEYDNKGLMASSTQPTKRTPVLAQFLDSLAPRQPQTLEQRLAALTDSDRAFLMTMAKMMKTNTKFNISVQLVLS